MKNSLEKNPVIKDPKEVPKEEMKLPELLGNILRVQKRFLSQ